MDKETKNPKFWCKCGRKKSENEEFCCSECQKRVGEAKTYPHTVPCSLRQCEPDYYYPETEEEEIPF